MKLLSRMYTWYGDDQGVVEALHGTSLVAAAGSKHPTFSSIHGRLFAPRPSLAVFGTPCGRNVAHAQLSLSVKASSHWSPPERR